MSTEASRFRAGDLVEVRSRDEILATLDPNGSLDGMPFMPEMLQFCGKQLRVEKVAHKTCDTICKTGGRSIKDSVHLEESRCDGSGHGGCQAQCYLFWKTAWLRKAGTSSQSQKMVQPNGLTVDALASKACVGSNYRCQATQILEASKPLAWWDVRQYFLDITSGNASAGTVLRVLLLSIFAAWRSYGYPYRLSRWCYDKAHRVLMGRQSPYLPDGIDYPEKSPVGETGLNVGELVRVKPHMEIRKTLNDKGLNRGLWFDVEMVPFCGKEFHVSGRVQKIINEETGEMMHMKGPCIMLQGVVCKAQYSDRRLLCPRAIPAFWREIWLERVQENAQAAEPEAAVSTASNQEAQVATKAKR